MLSETPEIDKRLLARRFGRRAETYEAVTPVQGRLAEYLIDDLPDPAASGTVRRIVELGCGTGRLTRLLRHRFPAADIVAVDLAAEMVDRARTACPDADFVVADAENYVQRLAPGIDLIISNAAVQWFATPAATLHRYRERLAHRGCLAFTTFADQTFRELRRALAQAYGGGAADQAARHLLPLPPVAFWRSLFPDAVMRERFMTDRYPTIRAFLQALQQAGVTHAGADRRRLPPTVLRRLLAGGANGAMAATYHAVSVLVAGTSRASGRGTQIFQI